jgi:hypothetical protein
MVAITGWIFIGLLIFLALAVIFKFQDVIFIFALVKKYMFAIVMIVIVLLLAFSLNFIHKNYDADLTTGKGLVKAGQVYFVWLKDFFVNTGRVTGYIANQEWGLNKTSSKIGG